MNVQRNGGTDSSPFKGHNHEPDDELAVAILLVLRKRQNASEVVALIRDLECSKENETKMSQTSRKFKYGKTN